ncbi:MAG: gamma-glutamyl-gamma-aminobutyrate hydrolase family protein, partial [Trueperaceae bacterium]|nr:gamma-glutamyl-gamma-aminobutyrate hydrolase family protein [Trueperaceae bacterium]
SFHRQVVVEPPAGWVVSARSDDGWVEAIEATEGFGVGIQFHPEWLELEQPRFAAVFRDFVAAAREHGAGRGVAREA